MLSIRQFFLVNFLINFKSKRTGTTKSIYKATYPLLLFIFAAVYSIIILYFLKSENNVHALAVS